MLLLLGQAVECANNARRCAIATTINVLTILFSMSVSFVFAMFLSRVQSRFCLLFFLVSFFETLPTPKRPKTLLLLGTSSHVSCEKLGSSRPKKQAYVNYPLKSAYLASLNLEIHGPFFSG